MPGRPAAYEHSNSVGRERVFDDESVNDLAQKEAVPHHLHVEQTGLLLPVGVAAIPLVPNGGKEGINK